MNTTAWRHKHTTSVLPECTFLWCYCIMFCFNFFRGCSSYTRVKKLLSESLAGVAAGKESRDEAGL